MNRKPDVRAYRQHHRVQPDFDSAPSKKWLPLMAIVAGGAAAVGAFVVANKGEVTPTPDKVQQVSTCAQEGLSSLALNGYEVTHQDVISNVNVCEISKNIQLSEEQHTSMVSTLEATN